MARPQPRMGTEGDAIGARLIAFVIDSVLIGIVTLVLALLVGVLGAGLGSEGVLGVGFFLVALVGLVLQFGYFIYFEGNSGQTPGKRLMNVVVVKEDGSPCDYGDATIRNVLRIVDQLGIVIPYLVALIVIYVTDENQRIGDLVADTVVVQTE